MTICRACSSEIPGPDRYCRNCGVLVAPSVTEWEETYRFNPASRPASVVTAAPAPDATNPLHYGSPGVAPTSASLTPPGSFLENLFKHRLFPKLFWLPSVLLFVALMGVTIGLVGQVKRNRDQRRAARQTTGENRAPSRPADETIPNALGLRPGPYSAAEFPEAQGIFVNNLMSDDGPAALAKIQAGDLLTELNGREVRNYRELSEAMEALKTGDEVPLKLYRDGATIVSSIKISDRHFPPLQEQTAPDDQGFLGILDASRRCCLPGTQKWGVEVKKVLLNSPAEIFGLRPGDIITEFNDYPIKTSNEFNRRIRSVKPYTKVPVTFYRGKTAQKVEVIIGHRW
ncbi:MAG TPA: PDZ domain-containing protein [Blastocatellia bacterium]|nr:PDZ domain-containing protein [Blastocatellia bacterium]